MHSMVPIAKWKRPFEGRWAKIIMLAFMGAAIVLAGQAFAEDAPTLASVATDVKAASGAAKDVTDAVNIMWMLIGGFLVFFMQAGFALVETGFTRTKNVAHTMMMNMMVFCVGAVGYWLVGFAFQFGGVNAAYPAVQGVGAIAGNGRILPPLWATGEACSLTRSAWGNGDSSAARASCFWEPEESPEYSRSSSSRWSSWTRRPRYRPARWRSALNSPASS